MTAQASLFPAVAVECSPSRFVQRDICLGRHGGNAESQEAHERVKAGKQDMWAKILDWGRKQPQGFTADEAVAHFDCSANHVAPRISELLAQGRLVRTAERRKTRSQCWARVLLVTQRRG